MSPISILAAMTNFYGPADRPEDWQQLLAKPILHWKTGYSAKSIAHSWTEAEGFPAEITRVFQQSEIASLTDIQFLLGFPEYDVPLPGGRRPSQNDVFVIARGGEGLVTIAVEGKVSEPFDLPVGERFANPTPGQLERLTYLCDLLELQREYIDNVGYQLLHRSASALIEAQRFGVSHAVMLVHSFSQSLEHFDDYARFARLFGVTAEPNNVMYAATLSGIHFHLGWVVGNEELLSR